MIITTHKHIKFHHQDARCSAGKDGGIRRRLGDGEIKRVGCVIITKLCGTAECSA
jgi:hypothetical protein